MYITDGVKEHRHVQVVNSSKLGHMVTEKLQKKNDMLYFFHKCYIFLCCILVSFAFTII